MTDWHVVRSELAFEHPALSIRVHTVQDPDGAEHSYIVGSGPDIVLVVPLWDDGTVTLHRQFRYGFEERTLEVPGGHVEEGETPEDAARRELAEEAGLAAGRMTHLLTFVPQIKIQQHFHAFLAEDLSEIGASPAADEHIEPFRAPLETVADELLSGGIAHGATIVALQAALRHERAR